MRTRSEQKTTVKETVIDGILNGSIAYSKDLSNVVEVKKYVSGLVNNHIRRAKELNGSIVYKSSKVGSIRDSQIREMTKLLESSNYPEGSEQRASIQSSIATRTAMLQSEKVAKRATTVAASIDMSVLPDNITDLLND